MIARILTGVLVFACFASADTFVDDFNVAPCVYPDTSCDVIGDPLLFDIEKAEINLNASATTIDYYLNWPNNSYDWFNYGTVRLDPGDIFFSNSSGKIYGITLSDHDGYTAGKLYGSSAGVATQTAFNVLGLTTPPYYYRPGHDVWLASGAPLAGSANYSVATNGNGTTTGAKYMVSLTLDNAASSALYGAAVGNGGWLDAHFQSATCANDILDGRISVPEPTDYALLGALPFLLGLGLYRRRRNVIAG